MKKLYVILFSLFYGPISCTQPITYYWVTADDTTKIWISDKDFNPQTAEFHWDGPTFENLAHGTGTLHINTDHGKMAQHLNAFYGATDQKGIMKDLKKGNQYIGPKQNGKPHGFGVLVRPNNDLDIGHFQEGRLNGNVTFIRQGKPYYRGQYANDAFNGIGIRYDNDGEKNCVWKDGVAQACRGTKHLGKDKYTGYYTLNGCEGRGKMEYANGDVYEGEWKANERNGQGRMDFADGRVYEGEWADGFAHGEGTYETNTFIYSGMWEKSAPDGFGFMKYIDGAKYNGTWKKGKKDGYGDFLFPNGDAYFGNWKDDQKQGNGRYLFADGSYYVGEMANDVPNGIGEFDTPNFHYIGDVEGGQPSGQGTVNFANGDVYIGNLRDGKKEGLGHYTFAESGNYYEGTFVDDKFDGLGIFHFKGVGEYQGVFAEGKPFGEGQFAFTEGGEDVQVLIKGMWNGFELPEDVEIKFANGDIYKGKIVNGTLSPDGEWSREENGIFKKISKSAALSYREHHETIEKVLPWITVSLLAISVVAITIASAGTATAPAVAADSQLATYTYGTMLVTEATYCVAQTNSNMQLDGVNAETGIKAAMCAGEFVIDAATPPVVGQAVAKTGKVAQAAATAGGATATKAAVKAASKKVVKKAVQKSVKEIAQNTGKVLIKTIKKVWQDGADYITRTAERMNIKKYQNNFSKEIVKILKEHPEKAKKLEKIYKEFAEGKKRASQALREGWNELFPFCKEKCAKNARAHHICPVKDRRGKTCRELLKKCKIDINSPFNTAMLPANIESGLLGTIHQGSHFDLYFSEITELITEKVHEGRECEDIYDVLDTMRLSLFKGEKPLNKLKKANTLFGTRTIPQGTI